YLTRRPRSPSSCPTRRSSDLGDEFVAGGDYFLPEGVQNYSILEEYVPEGYKMSVSGDFMVAAGTSLDVPVEKLVENAIVNIRFKIGRAHVRTPVTFRSRMPSS